MVQKVHMLDITENMVAGEEIIDNGIPQYKRNNLLACLNIPDRKTGMGYEELVKFILGHPLSTAFTEGTYVIPQALLEFWYTCRVEGSAGDIIIGTVNDGKNTVRITPTNLRKILRVPILPKSDPKVSKSQSRSVLLEIGNPTAAGVIKKSQFTTKWGFLVSTIVRSLGTKIGSLNNVNDVEMQLLYALVKGRNLDFAQLFFNDLKNHVCKKPRDLAAPYSRFVSMCIQDSIGDLYDSLAEMFETVETPKLTYKMFNGNIRDDEEEMPSTMRFWINNPFQPTSSSSEATNSALGSSSSSSSSSESMNGHNPTLPPPPTTSVAAPYCTSFHPLDILAQAANVTSRNQGVKSSSQQSPISLTREVRDLASAFQSYEKVQDNRYADMQNEMSRMRSVQESLLKAVQDLKDHIPRTSELAKSIKIIKDNSVSIDMTKDHDNDKKGESTKRRESDDDPEEGETGYKRYKRTKRKIIDEETQPTQSQPPKQLSQADAAKLQLVQIQPPDPTKETFSLETPQIVVNQGIENKAIKNKYPLDPRKCHQCERMDRTIVY